MLASREPHLSTAFYLPLGGGRYEPTESTIGPWARNTQHGGPPGALLMHALSSYPSEHGLEIARITIEILGPVPVGTCEVAVERVRGGKRIELLRAQYATGGKVFMMAHAWRAGFSLRLPCCSPGWPDANYSAADAAGRRCSS